MRANEWVEAALRCAASDGGDSGGSSGTESDPRVALTFCNRHPRMSSDGDASIDAVMEDDPRSFAVTVECEGMVHVVQGTLDLRDALARAKGNAHSASAADSQFLVTTACDTELLVRGSELEPCGGDDALNAGLDAFRTGMLRTY